MKSTITNATASVIAVALFTVGFAIGCLIWVAIGWCLGSQFHAPVSGALTGLAWQLGACISQHELVAASVERNSERFAALLDR